MTRQSPAPEFSGFAARGEQVTEVWRAMAEDHIMTVKPELPVAEENHCV